MMPIYHLTATLGVYAIVLAAFPPPSFQAAVLLFLGCLVAGVLIDADHQGMTWAEALKVATTNEVSDEVNERVYRGPIHQYYFGVILLGMALTYAVHRYMDMGVGR